MQLLEKKSKGNSGGDISDTLEVSDYRQPKPVKDTPHVVISLNFLMIIQPSLREHLKHTDENSHSRSFFTWFGKNQWAELIFFRASC